MEATSIIAVILAPIVVAVFALFQQRQQYDHEKEYELRSVLEDAARQATIAKWAVDKLIQARREGATATDARWKVAKDFLDERVDGPRHAQDRIAIRVGVDSTLHEAYSTVLGRMDEYRRNALRLVEGDARPEDPIATPFLRESAEEAQALIFEAARERVGLSGERWWNKAWSRIRRR